MTPVSRVDLIAAPSAAATAPTPEGVDEAAREFEAIFVRQLLEASHVGDASGAYANLSVDAIAKAIADGGGLGLARTIVRDMTPTPSEVDRFG